MNYYNILKEREKYKIAENLYKCPICEAEKTIKGFIQHVKNHFYERDLTNFYNSAKLVGKNCRNKLLKQYNENPNKCLFCGNDILAK